MNLRRPLATCHSITLCLATAFCAPSFGSTVAVHTGTLTLNLDPNAWGYSVQPGTYEGYGTTQTPSQPHLALAKYYSAEDLVGRKLYGSGPRPDLNGIRPVVNIGTEASPIWSVDIRQFRSAYDAYPPETAGLQFSVYDTAPSVPAGSMRFPHGTDFTIDSSGAWNTASGEIGTGGALAFYYANDNFLAYPNSGRWFGIGEFALSYDPNRATDWGLSKATGWILTSSLMGDAVAFDTENVNVSVVDGVVSISGSLIEAPDLNGFTAHVPETQLGTFSFSSAAVPEPSSALLLLATVSGYALSRRGRASAKK